MYCISGSIHRYSVRLKAGRARVIDGEEISVKADLSNFCDLLKFAISPMRVLQLDRLRKL